MGRYKTWNETEPEINNYIKLILIELFNLNNIGRKRGMTSELVLISSDEYDYLHHHDLYHHHSKHPSLYLYWSKIHLPNLNQSQY